MSLVCFHALRDAHYSIAIHGAENGIHILCVRRVKDIDSDTMQSSMTSPHQVYAKKRRQDMQGKRH